MTKMEYTKTTVSEIIAKVNCIRVESVTPKNMTTATRRNSKMSHTNCGKGWTLNSDWIVSWMVPPIIGKMAEPSATIPV